MTNEKGRPHELLRLDGQRALVTGASGNIGRGIAGRLAAAGADVVVHYCRDEAGAERTVTEIRAAGGSASKARADLSREDEVDALFGQLAGDDEFPTAIVNNAAVQPVSGLAEMSSQEWRAMMAANLDSAFYVTRGAAQHLRQRGLPGAVVNIASIEGLDPAEGHAHYASSKAALIMFTRSAAMEYGRQGLRVNAVSPGLIDRDGLADSWPEGVRRWLDRAPLGRLGEVGDVADAVLFLLSPAARWITGANLVVDGGMSSASRW